VKKSPKTVSTDDFLHLAVVLQHIDTQQFTWWMEERLNKSCCNVRTSYEGTECGRREDIAIGTGHTGAIGGLLFAVDASAPHEYGIIDWDEVTAGQVQCGGSWLPY
jgi:hypothetical protein